MTDKDKECRSQREALLSCPFCSKPAREWKAGFVMKRLCACSDNLCAAYFMKATPDEWNTRHQAGAAWQQSHLLDEELVENAVKAARQEWYARTSTSLMCFKNLDTGKVRDIAEIMVEAAIAEIKKHLGDV